jgi:putative FmdB family regulatory protein
MPLYAYKCVDCDDVFEVRRPMSEASEPMLCPDGHQAKRMLTAFAATGVGARTTVGAPAPTGGGGCGSGCGCHH